MTNETFRGISLSPPSKIGGGAEFGALNMWSTTICLFGCGGGQTPTPWLNVSSRFRAAYDYLWVQSQSLN